MKSAPTLTVRQLPCVDTGESTFTDVTVTIDINESDGDTVTVRGTYTYFDGGSTATLVPVSGGTISGDSILITGSGAVTFTLTLSNDNYDDTIEVAATATDSEGTDYDWMTFLTDPCGVTPTTTTTTTTTLPNSLPTGTLTISCTPQMTTAATNISVSMKLVDDDNDDVVVDGLWFRRASISDPAIVTGDLTPQSGGTISGGAITVTGGAGTAVFSGVITVTDTSNVTVSVTLDDGTGTKNIADTNPCDGSPVFG
ncbi:MAG: hypothetical protein ACPG7T_03965 [Ilumatobacteraceae bacterium]